MSSKHFSSKLADVKSVLKKKPLVRAIALALLAGSLAVPASVWANTVIDFEQFSQDGMYYFPGYSVPTISRLTDQLLSTHGVLFSSDAGYVAIVNLGTADAEIGFTHTPSGIMGIGGADSNNKLNYASPITISFFDPTNVTVKAVTNLVSIRGDLAGSNADVTIEGFGIGGNLVASSTVKDMGGETLSLSAEGIHSVKIHDYSSGTIGFDDLTFGTLKYQPSTCKDPAKHARYSLVTGKVSIPFTDLPSLEETSPDATGEIAVFKNIRLRLNANQDFEVIDSSVKPDNSGEPVGDPCHAVYTYENRTLKIPMVEVPTILSTFPTIKEGKPISIYEVMLQHIETVPIDLGILHVQEAKLIEVIE